MVNLAYDSKFKGGFCYAACQELFSFYNPSVLHCRKGCDFARGRVNDPELREEAQDMCKQYTAEMYFTDKGQLESIKDLRVYADMFPTNPENIYRVCLSGTRRQTY